MPRRRTMIIALVTFVIVLAAVAVGILLPTDFGRDPVDHARAPRIWLHRGGSSRWPQNTLTAMRGAVSIGAPGVEMDLGLTRDGVPVVVHDPWLDPVRCTTVRGEPIGEVSVAELTFDELRAGYLCGGRPDPDFPAVTPVAGRVPSLDEVLAELSRAPGMAIYLDVKTHPGHTRSPEDFAAAIFARLRPIAARHPIFIEGPDEETVIALRAAAGDVPFTPLISAPAFRAGTDWTAIGVSERIRGRLSPSGPVKQALAAGAKGIVTHPDVLDWRTAEAARDAGLEVILFGPQSRADVERLCTWPITGLILSDPALGDCGAEPIARGVARSR